MKINQGTRTRRHPGLLGIVAFVQVLWLSGPFQCGASCRLAPAVAATPGIASTCCHPSVPMPDAARTVCPDHEGARAPGLKPGCSCRVDSHPMPGPLPQRVSETGASSVSTTDIAPPEFHPVAEGCFIGTASPTDSPPGPGSRETYLRIASLRI